MAMASQMTRRSSLAPNGSFDGEIASLLERVCAKLPHDYTRRLVRDMVRQKLELGYEENVRDYLKRRSGEYEAVASVVETTSHES
jgi:hypothetical protein